MRVQCYASSLQLRRCVYQVQVQVLGRASDELWRQRRNVWIDGGEYRFEYDQVAFETTPDTPPNSSKSSGMHP